MTAPAHIVEAARRAKNTLLAEYPELAHDEDALWDTLDGVNGAQDMVASLIRKSKEDKAFIAGIKEYVAELGERSSRLARRAKAREDAAFEIMEALGMKKLVRPDFTLSVVQGRPKVVIVNEEAIPKEFVRITIKEEPDKRAIAEALERGETVAGATLSNATPHITVRTK